MEAIKIIFSNSPEGIHFKKTHENHPMIFEKICLNMLNEGENIIGEGNAAKVFFVGHSPSHCVKVIKSELGEDAVQFPIDTERDIQEKASRLNVGRRFVPYPSFAVPKTEDNDTEMLVMERVNGVSIRDVLENSESFPASFNVYQFFEKLQEYIDSLHENNIYHRDLHEGNVMIDNDTGLPWIIDFGASQESIGSDEEEIYNLRTIGSVTRRLLNDNNSVNTLRKKVLQYLSN